jgi:hypothetical protein
MRGPGEPTTGGVALTARYRSVDGVGSVWTRRTGSKPTGDGGGGESELPLVLAGGNGSAVD